MAEEFHPNVISGKVGRMMNYDIVLLEQARDIDNGIEVLQ